LVCIEECFLANMDIEKQRYLGKEKKSTKIRKGLGLF
jgi:hypothetical protein